MNGHDDHPIIPALEHATHAVALWIERAFGDTFGDPRLTEAEAHVLAFLARHAPCPINDLHRSFGHKRSTLTSLVDRLEGRGWVRRGPHPTSRRLVLVRLTDAGQPIAEHGSAAMAALEARVLARTGPGDLAAYRRVLRALEEELAHEPST
jgi:DNA-binding MarR family transcriptional regulator